MLAFAKDKQLWERIRTSPDFERHRREVLEKYEQVWQVPTPALSYWQVVGEDDRDVGKILYNRGFQLYTTAILALIYTRRKRDRLLLWQVILLWLNLLSVGRLF